MIIQQGSNFHWGSISDKDKEKDKDKKDIKRKTNDETKEALLDKNIESKTFEQFLTLKNLDLSIKQGEFVCIIGDVGSGKSSLLNAIIGDLQYCNP